MHHSLANQDLAGNPWFEGRRENCIVKHARRVRSILERYNNVVAVVNGHLHWNNVTVHGSIPYVTVQSAIENYADNGIPANAWGEIAVEHGVFDLRVFGNDPFSFRRFF